MSIDGGHGGHGRGTTGRAAEALLALTALLLLAAALVAYFQWNTGNPDVDAYWQAGLAIRRGELLYRPATGPLDKVYLYPPLFAALFALLTLLSPIWGYALWAFWPRAALKPGLSAGDGPPPR